MTQEKSFQNLYPNPERRKGFGDMLRYVLVERHRSGIKEQLNPFKPTPVVANDGEALRDNASRTSITWVGHSTFLVPARLSKWFHSLGCQKVHECGWWEELELLGLHFDFVPSQHWSGRTLSDSNKTLWGGWILSDGSQKLYFAGDSSYFSGFKIIGERYPGIDIAFMPVGTYEPRWTMQTSHVTPEEAGQAFLDVGARIFVPMHWGTFRLSIEPPDEPPRRLAAWWGQQKLDPVNRWTMAVGETRYFDKSHSKD